VVLFASAGFVWKVEMIGFVDGELMDYYLESE